MKKIPLKLLQTNLSSYNILNTNKQLFEVKNYIENVILKKSSL